MGVFMTVALVCPALLFTINGRSLEPLLFDKVEISARPLFCAENPAVGDLLIFKHAGNHNPVVKIIKAVGGQRFSFVAVKGAYTDSSSNDDESVQTPRRLRADCGAGAGYPLTDSHSMNANRSEDNLLVVEGEIVLNSQEKAYLFSGKRAKMLRLYMDDYKGRLPPDTFLVLGDNMNGTIDSSTFGLVHINDVIGVVPHDLLPSFL